MLGEEAPEDFLVAEAWYIGLNRQTEFMGPTEVFWAYLMEIKDMIEEGDTSLSLDNIAGRMLWRAACEWDIGT